jgi:hypothetical protein
MADPDKKYTLVQAANGDLYLVNEEDETVKVLPPQQLHIIQQMSPVADKAMTDLFYPILGSGVRVRVPKVFD